MYIQVPFSPSGLAMRTDGHFYHVFENQFALLASALAIELGSFVTSPTDHHHAQHDDENSSNSNNSSNSSNTTTTTTTTSTRNRSSGETSPNGYLEREGKVNNGRENSGAYFTWENNRYPILMLQ